MRTTVVPAQITTVEDRIAGSLTLPQLLLLVAPIFFGSGAYIILPPLLHNTPYKIASIGCLFIVCSLLAIRVRGALLLDWLITILRFNFRPRYYVANKSFAHSKNSLQFCFAPEIQEEVVVTSPRVSVIPASLSIADVVRLQAILENPQSQLAFKTTKKGGLRVLITEIEA